MDGYVALQGYIGHADSNDMCRLEGNGPRSQRIQVLRSKAVVP